MFLENTRPYVTYLLIEWLMVIIDIDDDDDDNDKDYHLL